MTGQLRAKADNRVVKQDLPNQSQHRRRLRLSTGTIRVQRLFDRGIPMVELP